MCSRVKAKKNVTLWRILNRKGNGRANHPPTKTMTMRQYTVYLSEKIQDPEDKNVLTDIFNFSRVSSAKKFIRQHMAIYKSSCVTRIWANGQWENLGEIQLGNNKHFIANARMKKDNY